MKALLLFAFAASLAAQEIPAADASAHVGQSATVCGLVTGIHTAAVSKGKPTFLNFDKRYPAQDFTVTIWDDDRPAFGDLARYTGHQVCARGHIKEFRGKPEMVVHDPASLEQR